MQLSRMIDDFDAKVRMRLSQLPKVIDDFDDKVRIQNREQIERLRSLDVEDDPWPVDPTKKTPDEIIHDLRKQISRELFNLSRYLMNSALAEEDVFYESLVRRHCISLVEYRPSAWARFKMRMAGRVFSLYRWVRPKDE